MFLFPTQRVLYEALLRNEEAAFAHLYRLIYVRLVDHVRSGGGDTTQAHDLTHEAIVAFLYRLKAQQYEWRDETELTTYVVAIGRNIWSYKQRQQQRLQTLPDFPEIPTDTDPNLEPDFERRRKAVEQAMAQLGEKCRRAIELYYWDKLSMQQIARLLGWANEGVARKEKSRCLKSLRGKINGML